MICKVYASFCVFLASIEFAPRWLEKGLKGRAPPCIQPVQSCFKILKEAGRRLLLFARRKNKGESTPFVTFSSIPSPFVPSPFSPFRIFFFFFFQGLVKSIAPKTDVNNGTPLPLDPCRDVDTRFTRLGR